MSFYTGAQKLIIPAKKIWDFRFLFKYRVGHRELNEANFCGKTDDEFGEFSELTVVSQNGVYLLERILLRAFF